MNTAVKTKRWRLPLAIGVATMSLIVAGCGSTPAARVHSLLGPNVVVRAAGAPASPGGAFILESIRVPASVDQPQWLVRLPDDSLASLESERWASPLRDEFRQALLVDLTGRFGWVDARDDRTFAASAWRVRIDVLRFESIAGREARVEGTWTLTAPSTLSVASASSAAASSSPKQPPLPFALHCDWRFTEPASGGMPAMAAAHRRNVARLADAVGQTLGRLREGAPAACPAPN